MCRSEIFTSPTATDQMDDEYEGICRTELEDPNAILFSETCHLMEMDTEWLCALPRSESDLLMRYFGDQVTRMRDLPDYRTILWECISALNTKIWVVRKSLELNFAPICGLEYE